VGLTRVLARTGLGLTCAFLRTIFLSLSLLFFGFFSDGDASPKAARSSRICFQPSPTTTTDFFSVTDFVAMTPASSFITDHSAVLLLRLLISLMLDFISLLTRHPFL
jgi:hypothetical protein